VTRSTAALVAIVTLLVTAAAVRAVAETPEMALNAPLGQFPIRIAGWQGSDEFFDPAVVAGLHVNDYLLREYWNAARDSLWFYVAYYGAQPVDTRVHSPAVCLPGAGWVIMHSDLIPIAVADPVSGPAAAPGAIVVNRILIQKGDEKQLVLYWYQIHGQVAAREMRAIGLLAWTAFTRHATDEALVRINAPIGGSLEATSEREVAFVRAMFPTLRRLLPGPAANGG